MRFFTLIIHTLPANTIAAAVEWCALIVHTHTHTQPPVSMSVCVWLKHYRSSPWLFTSANKHTQTQTWCFLFQSMSLSNSASYSQNPHRHTDTNKQTKTKIIELDLRLLLQTIIPFYHVVLLHLLWNSALKIAVLLLVCIPSARRGDVQWQCFRSCK